MQGMGLWVTLFEIKIKEVEVKEGIHGSSFHQNVKHISF
jgi:hypothetical protein